jgi:hypothetical protein
MACSSVNLLYLTRVRVFAEEESTWPFVETFHFWKDFIQIGGLQEYRKNRWDHWRWSLLETCDTGNTRFLVSKFTDLSDRAFYDIGLQPLAVSKPT